jgi:hypothetical protein
MQENPKYTTNNLPHADNSLLEHCEIVELDEMQLRDANGFRTLEAGPALALHVPPEMLLGADLEGGVQMCSAVLTDGEHVVALTFLRGGGHLAVAITDLGDPEVQRLAAKSLESGHLLVMLSSSDRDVLTVHPVNEMLRERLASSASQRPADLLMYARAVRQAVATMVDEQALRELNVDPARIASRSIAVHMGASVVTGIPTNSEARTIH